jgi:hypothetical protein
MAVSKNSGIHNHLQRSDKRHSGIHTVTPAPRLIVDEPAQPKRESPFPPLDYGPDAGVPQTKYKPILRF